MFNTATFLAVGLIFGLTFSAAAQEVSGGIEFGPRAKAGIFVGPTVGYGPIGRSYYSPDLSSNDLAGATFGYVERETDYNTGYQRRTHSRQGKAEN
jgi:hypothetical protein